jgi:hypothetical protein
MIHTTVISGYHVEYDTDTRQGTVISNSTDASASLEGLLEGWGVLRDQRRKSNEEVMYCTIRAIESWARARGYRSNF